MQSKNLYWEDGHLGNVYLQKDPEKGWVAGVLDQDRIVDFNDMPRNSVAKFHYDLMRKYKAGRRVNSLSAAQSWGEFPNSEYAMEKVLEQKGWIKYNKQTGEFESGTMDIDLVMEHFPGIEKRAHINSTEPYQDLERYWGEDTIYERSKPEQPLREGERQGWMRRLPGVERLHFLRPREDRLAQVA